MVSGRARPNQSGAPEPPAPYSPDTSPIERHSGETMKQVNPRLTSREEPGGPDASGEAMQRATSCPGRMAG